MTVRQRLLEADGSKHQYFVIKSVRAGAVKTITLRIIRTHIPQAPIFNIADTMVYLYTAPK